MNADKKNLRGTERQQGIRETREVAKILLVEDNEMNRDMLSRRLQRKGYEVLIAVDGAEGVEMAHAQPPDPILIDMRIRSGDCACAISTPSAPSTAIKDRKSTPLNSTHPTISYTGF